MAKLGGLDLRLDPWNAEYGTEIALGPAGVDAGTSDLSVEVEASAWTPLTPAADALLPERIAFIDGVRRVEARVLARDGERLVHGAFGSFGVGCTIVEGGSASWGPERIERVLALSGGMTVASVQEVANGVSYRPVSAAEDDPEAPLRRLQEEMRMAESALARDTAADGTLVVADGPLRFDDHRGAAVGYVKRFFERHGVSLAALACLRPGTRSPLLAISGRGFSRYSWFVRLAPRGPADFDLAGLVRLEVSDGVGLQAARRLADGTALRLPDFAPSRSRDPRAPQNLLPIGALESRLRRAMGDPLLARRRIETFLARPELLHA
jgi:hypothetical protein